MERMDAKSKKRQSFCLTYPKVMDLGGGFPQQRDPVGLSMDRASVFVMWVVQAIVKVLSFFPPLQYGFIDWVVEKTMRRTDVAKSLTNLHVDSTPRNAVAQAVLTRRHRRVCGGHHINAPQGVGAMRNSCGGSAAGV